MAAPTVTALEDQPPTTTARKSATVAGWTLVSRATGLLRVVVIGAVLGPTYFANAFQAGYVVPNLVFTMVAGPVLAMVLVPGVVRAIGAGGVARGREVLGGAAGWLLGVSGAVVALLMILSPAVAWTLTFGIPDPAARARGLWLTTVLILLVAPQVLLYILAHLGMAAQQSRGRFALAAGAPAVENVILIADRGLGRLVLRDRPRRRARAGRSGDRARGGQHRSRRAACGAAAVRHRAGGFADLAVDGLAA